jgi:hypothetical protein
MPPDRWYAVGRAKVEQLIAADGEGPRIDDPAAVRDYFARLYHTGSLDADGVQAMRSKFQFRAVAEAYRLIRDATEPVVVATWKPHRTEIAGLLRELADRPRRAVFRRLAAYQVNLFPHQRLRAAALIHEGPAGVLVWDGRYDDQAGIADEMADDFIV